MRHMVVYKSEGYDTSAFAQLYGSFYDYTVDSCRVERCQGLWGQSGWFVQFRDNDVLYATTFHPGIGPHGDNPEGNLPFSFLGLTDGNLRLTKFGALQYGTPGGTAIFVNSVLPHPVPGARGTMLVGNTLRFNQRVALAPTSGSAPPKNAPARFVDVVIDANDIEHSPVGIQIGSGAVGVVVAQNRFSDVKTPLIATDPDQVLSLDRPAAPSIASVSPVTTGQ